MSEENTTTEETKTEEVVSYGLKETKEAVAFGIALGEAVDVSLADGKIGLDDAMNFYNAVLKAGDAFSDIGLVAKELGDLDAAERQELQDFVEAEFDIANDKLEEVIECALETVLQVYELVEKFKGMKA
jgi:hypothetical protein